jgi:hypothetical protein
MTTSDKKPETNMGQDKKKRLSSALRENLKRRKAAPRPAKNAREESK